MELLRLANDLPCSHFILVGFVDFRRRIDKVHLCAVLAEHKAIRTDEFGYACDNTHSQTLLVFVLAGKELGCFVLDELVAPNHESSRSVAPPIIQSGVRLARPWLPVCILL